MQHLKENVHLIFDALSDGPLMLGEVSIVVQNPLKVHR
jgi:hypothetical protein